MEELKKLLEANIIEFSKSQWASPLITVLKRDGGIKLCGDYRRLNAITESNPYCFPKIDEQHISQLDLCKGFYKIPMKAQDKECSQFLQDNDKIPLGKYYFNRMPFGLKNAIAIFQ